MLQDANAGAAGQPADYWDHPDPIVASLVHVKGQRRREMLREHLLTGEPVLAPEWVEALGQCSLSRSDARLLAGKHPTWIGGEDLPDFLRGEVEIARIVLRSVTLDVLSIRARREMRGTLVPRPIWRYRMVDEYNSTFAVTPVASVETLTEETLIGLIAGAAAAQFPADGRSFPDRLRGDLDPDVGEAFVLVESLFYPGLSEAFARKAQAWAAARRAELWEGEDVA